MQINFLIADIENDSITTLKFKNDLLDKKDIMLYATRNRLDEPVILDLLSRIFFKFAKGSESTTKYIKALYEAEVMDRNISKAEAIALERIDDWAIYPDEELDKESIARFVELHYRFKKLNYSQDSLHSMMTYWQDNVSPKVIELKESLGLEECCNWDNEFDYSGYITLGIGIAISASLIGLTYMANFPFPYHLIMEEPD